MCGEVIKNILSINVLQPELNLSFCIYIGYSLFTKKNIGTNTFLGF
jgi:hypothetical protein